MRFVKKLLKRTLEVIPVDFLERILAISILKYKYSESRAVKKYDNREDLWRNSVDIYGGRSITFLEFGVFEGYSINFFSKLNVHSDSCFYGFDSFEGLPEDWNRRQRKGCFDVSGKLPPTNDVRIKFVKGWFQNTLPSFLSKNEISDNLVVHYDADIYSATLFVMMELDKLKKPYIAIFDEFTGHETRALYNYCQTTGAVVDFYGSVGDSVYPTQVSCKITPTRQYAP